MKATNLDTATAAWGDDMPGWVRLLATACDQASQSAIGTRLGVSGSLVNQVLHRKYTASLAPIEARVRGALMSQTVNCPGLLMDIPVNECLDHQKAPHSTVNPTRARLYRACRGGCPHSFIGATAPGAKA
jgi:hypothetical protein